MQSCVTHTEIDVLNFKLSHSIREKGVKLNEWLGFLYLPHHINFMKFWSMEDFICDSSEITITLVDKYPTN